MVVREAGLIFRGFNLVKRSYHKSTKGKIDDDLRSGLLTAIKSFAESAFTKGEEWLDQLVVYSQKNIDFVDDYLKKNIPQIKLIQAEATYLLWLDFSELEMSSEELKSFIINKAKLGLNEGIQFGPGGEGGHSTIRFPLRPNLISEHHACRVMPGMAATSAGIAS